MEKSAAKCGGYGMFTSICWSLGLGLVFGVLIGIPLHANQGWDTSELAALLATGIGMAYILLAIVDWFSQRRSLSSNPLPDDLDLSDRSVAAERLAALKGCSLLHRHIRRLLAAWAAGASGPQVAAMAGNQMLRMLGLLAAETAAILALLAFTASFIPPPVLLTLGTGLMVLLLLVAVARLQLASQLAGYIESHLLARIGNDTPAAASLEFARAVAKSVTDSMASLAAAQTQFSDRLAKAQQEAAALMAKAQQDAAAQMAKVQQESASQVVQAQRDSVAQIVKTQQESAAQVSKAQQDAAAQLGKAQADIAAQLGRLAELAGTIDSIFKLQQAVDGTLKGVAVADEFKSTLVGLNRHLAESDALLKNAAKPRTIRLVEKDNE